MQLNLTSLKKFVEDQMTDECVIYSDPTTTIGDELDEETGSYVQDHDSIVYQGKCFVATAGWEASLENSGGASVLVSRYVLNIHQEAPVIDSRDLVEITSSLRSPEMVGVKLKVVTQIISSFSVCKQYHVKALLREEVL